MPRGFVFTINNHQCIPTFNPTTMIGLCMAEQKGKEGTPHIQGVVFYKKDKSKRDAEAALKYDTRFFIEPMRGSWEQACKYINDGHGTNMAEAHLDGRDPTDEEESLHRFGQGKRHDIRNFIEAIEDGTPNYDLMKDHSDCWAKYSGLKERVENTVYQKSLSDIEWPLIVSDNISIQKPDAAVKQRHYYIWGPPSIGKTYLFQRLLQGKKAFMAPATALYRFEDYGDEDLIIYDDVLPCREELIEVSNTWLLRRERIGKARYNKRYWKLGHSRTIIILSNFTCPITDEAFTSRFICHNLVELIG